MSPPPAPPPTCAGEHCITCADEGVPMRVVRIDERRGLALCEDGEGARHTVDTALVDPVTVAGQLLIHAGVAIASLPREAEAPTDARRARGVAG